MGATFVGWTFCPPEINRGRMRLLVRSRLEDLGFRLDDLASVLEQLTLQGAKSPAEASLGGKTARSRARIQPRNLKKDEKSTTRTLRTLTKPPTRVQIIPRRMGKLASSP